jgi:hypothetical protein
VKVESTRSGQIQRFVNVIVHLHTFVYRQVREEQRLIIKFMQSTFPRPRSYNTAERVIREGQYIKQGRRFGSFASHAARGCI